MSDYISIRGNPYVLENIDKSNCCHDLMFKASLREWYCGKHSKCVGFGKEGDLKVMMLCISYYSHFKCCLDAEKKMREEAAAKAAAEEKALFEKVIADCTKMIQDNPKDGEAYRLRGGAYNQRKEYEKAIDDINKAIQLDASDGEAYAFRGAIYGEKNENEKAKADFNEAIRVSPNCKNAYMFRGIFFSGKGEYDKSIADYEKALSIEPDDSYTASLLENVRALKAKEDKARKAKRNKLITFAAIAGAAVIACAVLLYNSQKNSVTIPDGVTVVRKGVYARKHLIRVRIPDSVTSIENNAFRRNKLTSVVIPDSVTSIGDGAFSGNRLTSISIGSNVTLGSEAFGSGFETAYSDNAAGSGTYKRINAKSGEWSVWYNDIEYQYNNGNITITGYSGRGGNIMIPEEINGNPVTVIGDDAFREKEITDVTIPSKVDYIGERAFYINQLTGIVIPNSVTSIGRSAFNDNKLTSMSIGSGVTSIGIRAFRQNQLTGVVLPNNVTSVGWSAFEENPVTSVRIGANVTLGSDDSQSNVGILGQGTGFNSAYANNGNRAGTYTRPNAGSSTWTRR